MKLHTINVDLKITEDDLISLGLIRAPIKLVTESNNHTNAVGTAHTEITGSFIRQVPIDQVAPIIRAAILNQIINYFLETCNDGPQALEMRVWPEAILTGIDSIQAKWYARLSIYALEPASA